MDTKELEDHVFAPNEPRVDISKFVPDLQPTRSKIDLGCQRGKMGGALRMLMVLEWKCLGLREAIEQLCEKQELLATLMDSKKSVQNVALEETQRQIFSGVEGVLELNSSIGAALNHLIKNMTDEFSSKNVLRHVIMGSRKDPLVKS